MSDDPTMLIRPFASQEPVTIRLGHQNMQSKHVKRNADEVYDEIVLRLQTFAVIGLNEAASAEPILDRLRRNGYGVWYSEKPGSMSTPIVWNTKLGVTFHRARAHKLTPRVRIPRGAGPDLIKPKYLNIATFKVNGRILHFAVCHGLASISWVPLREPLGWLFFRRIAKILDSFPYNRHLIYLCGDMNMKPGSKWSEPLKRAGLRSTQQRFGVRKTHQVGPIDDAYVNIAPGRWKLVNRVLINSISDHDFYGVIVKIMPKQRRTA